jgi:hypothetical protein
MSSKKTSPRLARLDAWREQLEAEYQEIRGTLKIAEMTESARAELLSKIGMLILRCHELGLQADDTPQAFAGPSQRALVDDVAAHGRVTLIEEVHDDG